MRHATLRTWPHERTSAPAPAAVSADKPAAWWSVLLSIGLLVAALMS